MRENDPDVEALIDDVKRRLFELNAGTEERATTREPLTNIGPSDLER